MFISTLLFDVPVAGELLLCSLGSARSGRKAAMPIEFAHRNQDWNSDDSDCCIRDGSVGADRSLKCSRSTKEETMSIRLEAQGNEKILCTFVDNDRRSSTEMELVAAAKN